VLSDAEPENKCTLLTLLFHLVSMLKCTDGVSKHNSTITRCFILLVEKISADNDDEV